MRPEPPASFKATTLERLGIDRLLSPAFRMVLRDMERRPLRLLLSAGSIALATSTMVLGAVSVDSVGETLRLQYEVSHREDITATFTRTRPWRAIRDLLHLPGVRRVEGERMVPVRLRAGPLSKTTAILGMDPDSDLHILLGLDKRPLTLPAGGLSLSRTLGDELGVRAGDDLEVEVLDGKRQHLRLPVGALVDDLIGLSGYMDRSQLGSLLDEVPTADIALLAVDRPALDEVIGRLTEVPSVDSVSRPDLDRHLLEAQVADIYFALEVILAIFASAIAVGVVYNNARVALEVRSRDLGDAPNPGLHPRRARRRPPGGAGHPGRPGDLAWPQARLLDGSEGDRLDRQGDAARPCHAQPVGPGDGRLRRRPGRIRQRIGGPKAVGPPGPGRRPEGARLRGAS